MLKKLIVVTVVLTVAALGASTPNIVPAPKGVRMYTAPLIVSESKAGGVSSVSGSAFQTAGDQGGITTYDYQSNGAMGNRIAVDPDGDAHISWMHSNEKSLSFSDRDVYYNVWKKSTGDFVDAWPSGVKASGTGKAGYTTIGLLSDYRAVVAYHHDPDADGVYESAVSIDAVSEAGAFSSPIPIDPITVPEQPIWPKIVIGPDDVIHVTAHVHGEGDPYNVDYLYYSRSTNGGVSFSPWEVIAQDAGSDAAMAVSADGKVAIAWINRFPITGTDECASHGNVTYCESTNSGQSWSSPVEVTDGFYGDAQPNSRDTITLGAISTSLDCCYDADNNLFIGWGDAWRAGYVENDTNWYSYYYRWFQRMMCWSEAGPAEPTVASGPCTQFFAEDDEGNPIDIFNMGFWGIAQGVDKYTRPGLGCWNPQLAAKTNGDMVYTWTGQWDSLDITAAGTINADIYASISDDGGASWVSTADWDSTKLLEKGNVYAFINNLTETHSPGAKIGESESEEYHSADPEIGSDGYLHLTYIHDLFAGSVVNIPTEGIFTDNPVMYLGSNGGDIMKPYVGDGPDTLIPETNGVKVDLNPNNVPVIEITGQNPVGSSVCFNVVAPNTHVSLKVYDATGTLVETLFEGALGDTRTLVWDASAVPAGVYFYSFVTPSGAMNGRVVVVH